MYLILFKCSGLFLASCFDRLFNMREKATLILLLSFMVTGAVGGQVLWQADFADDTKWEKRKTCGELVFSAKPDSLAVGGKLTNSTDTAWQIATKPVSLPIKGKYALCFRMVAKGLHHPGNGASEKYGYVTAVFWYDGEGRQIARHPFGIACVEISQSDYRVVNEVPDGAASFAVRIGFDQPNLKAGTGVRFSDLRIEQAAADESCGETRPDCCAPRIRIVSATPTRDANAPVVVSVTDPSGVDGKSVRVEVDGARRESNEVRSIANGFEIVVPCVEKPWCEGLHWLEVSARDGLGNVNNAKKAFLIGDGPATPAVTLRDDGMTLIGGEPFFPIGIYGVCRREFNAYDLDRALADLKAAGFNTVQSYGAARDPSFLDAVERQGMRTWMGAHAPNEKVVGRFRHSPSVIAWYLGDDTSEHATPEELLDRDDNIRAVDPTRITTQADVLEPMSRPDRYWDYQSATDSFLPEIYPVRGTDQAKDRLCVAQTVLEMKRVAEDQAGDPTGRRHSCWPIIQYFRGWGWKRFPTAEELYGMSFAAIIHGAQGVTWYTYGGFLNPEKKKFNYGVTSSEEVWRNTTNLTRRIARLVPVLTERTPAQPPVPTVLSGPKLDAHGNPSVTTLLKVRDGVRYLLAVNAADAKVRASFAPFARGNIDVLWEDRTVTADGQGGFSDTFAPLAVHVYRWR